jgi:hypothetical protein
MVPTVGTEAAHVEAENALIHQYLKQSDFPESCFIAGEWRPNVAREPEAQSKRG